MLFLPSLGFVASLLLGVWCDQNNSDNESPPATRLTKLRPSTQNPLQPQGNSRRQTVISGLLVSRQSCEAGFGLCSNGICCRVGGQCCTKGDYCCDPGNWCYATGCCKTSEGGCDNLGCCPLGDNCCKGGTCCSPSEYCDVVDGQQGCCPIGKVCTATGNQCTASDYVPCSNDDFCCPPGDTCYRDSDNNPRCRASGSPTKPPTTTPPTTTSPTTTTHKMTTTAEHTTTHATATTTAHATTTTTGDAGNTQTTTKTGSALTSVPTAPSGSQNVVVDLFDTSITWTGDWTTVVSSCPSTSNAKGVSGNLTTIASGIMGYSFEGSCVYLSITSSNAQYVISIDGDETDYGASGDTTPTPSNCTFGWSRTNLTATGSHFLQISVFGASTIGGHRRDADSGEAWALAIENLV
ncbi:hypothetical protein C8R44DRAFT_815137 [Mycena epipterygia]|nr:hypothetical protein C8R44DRAFT_815137 [Mycena epipterygia]